MTIFSVRKERGRRRDKLMPVNGDEIAQYLTQFLG
jgi:hypothetical protein